ncbi:MAG: hypothetical protein QM703_11300 [Gemmatales bacterium]
MGALSEQLLPILRERFLGRGLVEGQTPDDPCAMFPGLHPGIRRVAVYDDRVELTVSVDDITHGHFSDVSAPRAVGEQRTVEAVVEFLQALFNDQVAMWGHHNTGGGWYRLDLGGEVHQPGVPEFVWSGPLVKATELAT